MLLPFLPENHLLIYLLLCCLFNHQSHSVSFASVEVEPYWPKLFANLLGNRDVGELLANVGGGAAPAAAPAAAAAAPAAAGKKEEKKEEPKEEEEAEYVSI